MEIENKIENPVDMEAKEEDQRLLNFTAQPTRDFLERYYAEKLTSLKMGLDEVWQPSANLEGKQLTRLESIKAYWNICRSECDDIIKLFGEINPATMNPHHRWIMELTKHFDDLLQSNDIIQCKQTNGGRVKQFARWSVAYITAYHTCLDNDKKRSPRKKKVALVKDFKEFTPYAK